MYNIFIFLVSSLGLLATSGPTAFATKDAFHVAMTTLGTFSISQSSLKLYQLYAGKPVDMEVKK